MGTDALRDGDFDFRTFLSVESKGIDLSGREPRSGKSTSPKPLPAARLESALGVSYAPVSKPSSPDSLTPAPLLELTKSGDHLILYWPKALEGYTLEETEIIVPFQIWREVEVQPVNVGEHRAVSIPLSGAARFYRLRKP